MVSGSATIAVSKPEVASPVTQHKHRRVNRTLLAGLLLLTLIVLIAIIGPQLMPFAPDAFGPPLQAPSLGHVFGTDNFGRDVATRVVYAAHLNLLIGIVPT